MEAARAEAEAARAAKRRKKAAFDDAYDTGGAKNVDREVATGHAEDDASGSEGEAEAEGGEEGRRKKRGMGWARCGSPRCALAGGFVSGAPQSSSCWTGNSTACVMLYKCTAGGSGHDETHAENLDMHLIAMMPQCARMPSRLPCTCACTVGRGPGRCRDETQHIKFLDMHDLTPLMSREF